MSRNKSRTDKLRQVWKKSDGVCAHCGKAVSSRNRTVDHYVPKSKGGGFDIRNLLPLCKTCNSERGNIDIDPKSYYLYVSDLAIRQCLKYEKELNERY